MKQTGKQIGMITCKLFPKLVSDDLFGIPFLQKKNINTQVIVWDEVSLAKLPKLDALIFRSCWNYHEKYPHFLDFLKRVDALNIPVFNAVETIRWNLNKKHIIDFEGKVTVPKTHYFQTSQMFSLQILKMLLKTLPGHFVVVKPAVSLNGYDTYLIESTDLKKIESTVLSILKDRDVLLQEYIPEIRTSGEVSLVYFNKKFSHSVRKKAAHGEFRIHSEYGGTREAITPTKSILDYGAEILKQVPQDLLYARVDLVESFHGPKLIELEVTDPMLYMQDNETAAENFATAVADVL